jgi:hypothetical protein
LRALLPMFASIDREGARALIAINRWSVVDPICTRGALRDEIVEVTTRPHGEPPPPVQRVARELVRVHCLDAEDGRDRQVAIRYLRYDTAIHSTVDADVDAGTISYAYDDGPGSFSGDAHRHFLDWVIGLPKWKSARVAAAAPAAVPEPEPEGEPIHAAPATAYAPQGHQTAEIWARPRQQ